MGRVTRGIAALALCMALTAPAVHAQGAKFGIAGTGLFSLESGGGSQFGGMALVGFGGKAGSPLGFRVDGTVVHKSGITPVIGTGDLTYTFATAESSMFHPYLLAGGGVYHTSGFTKPLAKAGAGFDYLMSNSSVSLFGEATFDLLFRGSGLGTGKFLQVNAGVKFGG